METVALHDTGESLALAGARDVNDVAGSKDIRSDFLTERVVADGLGADLDDVTARRDAGLVEVARGRRVDLAALDLTEAELDSLHAAMVARHKLERRASQLPIAGLAYSVLIEDGAMRRLLDLNSAEETLATAISDLSAAIDGHDAIDAVPERAR